MRTLQPLRPHQNHSRTIWGSADPRLKTTDLKYLYELLRVEYSGPKKIPKRKATHEINNSRFLLFAILFSVIVSLYRGVPRNLKEVGAQFKAMPAGPHIFLLCKRRTGFLKVITSVLEQNKGHHVRRCLIFCPKSNEKQKKVFTPPDCFLYVAYIIFTPRKFCAFVCGAAPLWIRPCCIV